MKKHNEGYALVLVLVVITVLSLVAMAMTAASLRNLKNQQDSIDRMEAKYTAQGEIEKEIAKLNEFINEDGSTEKVKVSDLHSVFENALELKNSESQEDYLRFDQYYLLTLTSTKNNTVVNCKIRIDGSKAQENGELILLNSKWQYVSYTITEGGGS